MGLALPDIKFLPKQPLARQAADAIRTGHLDHPMLLALRALAALLPPVSQSPSVEAQAALVRFAEGPAVVDLAIGGEIVQISIHDLVMDLDAPALRAWWINHHRALAPHSLTRTELLSDVLNLGQTDLALSLLSDIPAAKTRIPASACGSLLARWARTATPATATPVLAALRPVFDRRLSDQGFFDQALDQAAVAGSLPALEAVLAHPLPVSGAAAAFAGALAKAFDEAYNACAPDVCARLLEEPGMAARAARHAENYLEGIHIALYPRRGMDESAIFPRATADRALDMIALIAALVPDRALAASKVETIANDMGRDTPFGVRLQAIYLDLNTAPAPQTSGRGPRL